MIEREFEIEINFELRVDPLHQFGTNEVEKYVQQSSVVKINYLFFHFKYVIEQ